MAGNKVKRPVWRSPKAVKIAFRPVGSHTAETSIACRDTVPLCAVYLLCLVISLIREVIQLRTELACVTQERTWYKEQLNRFAREKYIGKSNQTLVSPEGEQTIMKEILEFFRNSEETRDEDKTIEESLVIPEHKRKRAKRGKTCVNLLKGVLEEEHREYFPENMTCPECQEELRKFGKAEERRTLLIEPPKLKVLVETTYSAKCDYCEKNGISAHVVTGEMPRALIPGSFCSVELLAYIGHEKMVMAVPLYRQEKWFNIMGVPISRATMNSWILKGGEILQPFINRMIYWIQREDLLAGDETTIKYPDPAVRGKMKNGYAWVICTDRHSEHKLVVFWFHKGRNKEYHLEHIKEFQGYFQSDGYQVYHDNPGIISVGCHAHARARFVDAKKDSSFQGHASLAETGAAFFDKIFWLENKFRDMEPEARLQMRKKCIRPLMNQLHKWIEDNQCRVLPQSLLGKAMQYTLNQWKYLENIFLDGRLDISNNRAERYIKDYVIARKNFLFVQNDKGGNATAGFATLAATAKANGLDPYKYIVEVLKTAQKNKVLSDDILDSVMPWNVSNKLRLSMKPNHCTPADNAGTVEIAV